MLPQYHFLLGLIAAIILYFGFDVGILGCLIFLVATIGIDVDHYLYYVYKKRDWSLFNAIRWFLDKRKTVSRAGENFRHNVYVGFCFFHGLDIVGIFVALGYYVWPSFYFISLGMSLHLILDYIDNIIHKSRFDRVSVLWDFFRYRKLVFIEEAISLKS